MAVITACNRVAKEQQTAQVMGDPLSLCFHLQMPWSDEWCPDSVVNFRKLDSVRSISLSITTLDGIVHVTRVDPNADVIFLTKMAVDSVLVGYYRSKSGTDPRSAEKMKTLQNRGTKRP